MLPKPGKRDITIPKSWRPISLLSCLGKGLERLIVRRMSRLVVQKALLHPTQFGALLRRSATDLTSYLTHDIERTFSEDKVASLLTLDISGAFNVVQTGRLILRLRKQG